MSLVNSGSGDVRTPDLYPFSPALQVPATARFVQVDMISDCLVLPPLGGVDGIGVELRLFASGADRNLSFDDAIAVCQNGEDWPVTIDEGTTARVLLRYDLARNQWVLQGLLEQY